MSHPSGEREPIGVIGAGWVGLVTSACFAELGHRVVAVDVDASKVERLSRGEVPIHEPKLADLVRGNAERLRFTTDISEALAATRLLFCCVDTPPTYSGDADLSSVRAVVAAIADGQGDGRALVMKSTVPAGTGETIRRERADLAYVSCPEFLREGSAVDDFLNPDRVVIGADPGDEWAADAVAAAYRPLGGELVRTDVPSAEMIKLASNAFLATKISFANEIANVCDEVGADVDEVARGMGLDTRIGPSFLRAGIGYGGSCFHPDETLLVRHRGWPELTSFAELWQRLESDRRAVDGEAVEPKDLEVWSWVPGEAEPEWMPVSVLTRRDYGGEMLEVQTAAGHRPRVTADHPFVVGDGRQDDVVTRALARELTPDDWLPAVAAAPSGFEPWISARADLAAECRLSPLLGAQLDTRRQPRSGASVALMSPPRPSRRAAEARCLGEGPTWVRVTGTRTLHYEGPVYSLKVPGSQTVVTAGGLVASQCFPKDVSALKMLAGNTGYHFQLLNAVIEVNELQKRRVIAKLSKHHGSLVGKRIALLGLAFKPQTDDMREASSLVLAARLQGEGATVVAYDPVASGPASELLPGIEMSDSALAALEGADAAVLVTEWPQFAELDWRAVAAAMATPLVVDGRNFLDAEALREAGLSYEGIGRPRRSGGPRSGASVG